MDEIKRGNLYIADLDPVKGSEQGGRRPVLVVQNDAGNQHSPTVIIAAITSQKKPNQPTHVCLKGLDVLPKDSMVLMEQIRTIDKSRLEEYIGKIGWELMEKVDRALRISVDLKKLEPMLLTLCPRCAVQFYNSASHHIKKAQEHQNIKEVCMFCNVRRGVDYYIYPRGYRNKKSQNVKDVK